MTHRYRSRTHCVSSLLTPHMQPNPEPSNTAEYPSNEEEFGGLLMCWAFLISRQCEWFGGHFSGVMEVMWVRGSVKWLLCDFADNATNVAPDFRLVSHRATHRLHLAQCPLRHFLSVSLSPSLCTRPVFSARSLSRFSLFLSPSLIITSSQRRPDRANEGPLATPGT